MPKLFIIILLSFFSLTAYSQSQTSNEIVAEGNAKTKVRPDLATFSLTIEKRDEVEKNAIMLLNKTVSELTRSLNALGFNNESIKISNYNVSSSINNANKKTYAASNELIINFRINTKLIDAFYNEVQQAGIEDLDISFDTSVSDSLEKATRLKLVQQAIEDAKINAANISQALGVRLGKVKQVNKYGVDMLANEKVEMVKFTPPVIRSDNNIKYKTAFDKFQVVDVDLDEKITVVYEIAD